MSWRTGAGAALVVAAAIGTGVVWRGTESEVERPVDARLAQFDGETLFVSRGCSGCHSSQGPGARGPSLAEVEYWADERRPGMSAEEYIAESLRDPQEFISPAFRPTPDQPLQAMPDLGLTDAEVEALVAYLLED